MNPDNLQNSDSMTFTLNLSESDKERLRNELVKPKCDIGEFTVFSHEQVDVPKRPHRKKRIRKKWAKMYGWKKANGKLYEVGKIVSTNPIAFLDDIATYEMSISPKEEI